MLFGAALVIAFVRDGGDNAGLIVAPADAADAGGPADRRARAIGGDQETGSNDFIVRKRDIDAA